MSKKYVLIRDTKIELSRFAEVIRVKSKELDKTQEELATSITGLPERRPLRITGARQYISRIENQRVCPSSIRAEALMDYLEIDVDYILNYQVSNEQLNKAIYSGLSRIEEIFRDSDTELIERVVIYAEFLYSRMEAE